jgi:hypothetical protein
MFFPWLQIDDPCYKSQLLNYLFLVGQWYCPKGFQIHKQKQDWNLCWPEMQQPAQQPLHHWQILQLLQQLMPSLQIANVPFLHHHLFCEKSWKKEN